MEDTGNNVAPGAQPQPEPSPGHQAATAGPGPLRQSHGRGFSRRTFIAAVSAAVILGSVVGGVGGAALFSDRVSQAQAAPPQIVVAQPAALAPATGLDIAAIYKSAAPAVVTVKVTEAQTGRFRNVPTEGEGSGVIIDKDGHILTNNHVVSGASTITVTLLDGTDVKAQVVGTDPASDLALLKADIPASKLVVATLGDSDAVAPGDPAIAIGSPFGLNHSVTAGIVSAVKRDWGTAGGRPMRGLIQVDTPINPGNSGGALLNGKGEVIGITTAIESPVRGSVGVGFAIPINAAKSLLPQLTQGASIQHPWLGISGMSVNASVASQVGLKVNSGVLVMQVVDGSPAAKAGLKPALTGSADNVGVGDVITAVDGRPVTAVTDISSYLDTRKVGDTVKLSVTRGSENLTIEVTLAAWPQSQQS